MIENSPTITDKFNQYFSIEIVSDSEGKDLIHQLRYDIFCREFGFEKESDCPNQREIDQYDQAAIHCAVYHKSTKKIAGCIRVMVPEHYPNFKLPFEQYCNLNTYTNFCEISRLAVSTNFRRRQGDAPVETGLTSEVLLQAANNTMHRNFPLVPTSMMLAGVAIAKHHHRMAFAMMEPKLVNAMRTYGIHFNEAGQVVSYHGQRAAFYMEPEKVWGTIHPELKFFLNTIHESIKENTLKWECNRYNRKIS